MTDFPDSTAPSAPPTHDDAMEEAKRTIAGVANQAWGTTQDRAGEALHSGEEYVRQNPRSSVLSVFGLGLAVGVLIGWSMGRREDDDFTTRARKYARRWESKFNF